MLQSVGRIEEILDKDASLLQHQCRTVASGIAAVRAYADSSFILRLVTTEPGSRETIAEYRRVGKPPLFFLPLHSLEVGNGILG